MTSWLSSMKSLEMGPQKLKSLFNQALRTKRKPRMEARLRIDRVGIRSDAVGEFAPKIFGEIPITELLIRNGPLISK